MAYPYQTTWYLQGFRIAFEKAPQTLIDEFQKLWQGWGLNAAFREGHGLIIDMEGKTFRVQESGEEYYEVVVEELVSFQAAVEFCLNRIAEFSLADDKEVIVTITPVEIEIGEVNR